MAKRASSSTRGKSSAKAARIRMGPHTRLVVLHGKEPFLRQAYADELRENLTNLAINFDTIRFDGATATVAEVLDECRSFGLLASHKVVIVDNAEEWVKGDINRPMVERYAELPADDVALILRAETWRPGKLDKLIDALGEAGGVVKCDAITEAQAVSWARGRVKKRHERDIEPQAATELVARLGPDLGRIDTELAKLATATPEGEPIALQTVRDLVSLSREQEVWGLQSLLLSGRTEDSLAHMHELLTVSRVPSVLMRWAMTDLARKLHAAARGFASGMPAPAIASALKLWGPARDAILDAARRVAPDDASRLLAHAVDADAAGKSGRGDEIRGLELLAIRITSAVA
ncbi:MAG: DNA polymerase III subunit delta [Phycisphaerales bacterium]|nr:DNA polymerase III subunit delta [Phycisphaerales bacterium]